MKNNEIVQRWCYTQFQKGGHRIGQNNRFKLRHTAEGGLKEEKNPFSFSFFLIGRLDIFHRPGKQKENVKKKSRKRTTQEDFARKPT